MDKINNKSINLGLKIMAILTMGLLVTTPALAKERAGIYYYNNPPATVEIYETPAIMSVSPDEVRVGTGAKTITVTGSGFMPSSVAKINGANRYTTFIDDEHLLAQATAYDFYRTDGGFYVTVWNANSDYSNAAFVKITGTVPAPATNNNQNQNQNPNYNGNNYPNNNYGNGGYDNTPINYYPGALENAGSDPNETSGASLASSVILGGNTFLPSGIVQWVLVAIFIVFIIVLARKIFGSREHYDSTPLKHA